MYVPPVPETSPTALPSAVIGFLVISALTVTVSKVVVDALSSQPLEPSSFGR